jgi:hypothetical protein
MALNICLGHNKKDWTATVREAKMKIRNARIVAGLALLLFGAALAVAAKVESDYDPKANFSQYKTFTSAPSGTSVHPFAVSSELIVLTMRSSISGSGMWGFLIHT